MTEALRKETFLSDVLSEQNLETLASGFPNID